jgi:hypothetical protein
MSLERTIRPVLGLVSPLPPTPNGIADYAAELLALHQQDFDVVAVIADDQPAPVVAGVDVRVLRASQALASDELRGARFLYHIGNNPDHAYALPVLARYPGVVVLHDFNLSYLLETATFPRGDRGTYRGWLQHDHGLAGDRLAVDFLERGWRGRFMQSEIAVNGPVLARASALVTHNRYSQFKAAARWPGLSVHCLPHHVAPRALAARGIAPGAARRRLGLPPDATLVTALGFVTRPKLVAETLASLARLAPGLSDFRFVLAGQRRPAEYDVDADIASSGLADRVIVTDYLDEESFFLHLAAADVVVNLRYPTGGESSGTLTRAMGARRACVVLDHGPMGELPEGCVAKVAMGEGFARRLDATLGRLMRDRAARERLAASAAAAAQAWTPEASAARLRDILLASPPMEARAPAAPLVVLGRHAAETMRRLPPARQARLAGDRWSWWRLAAAPTPDAGRAARLLIVAPDFGAAEILETLFGWDAAALTHATWADLLAGEPAGTYDAALALRDAPLRAAEVTPFVEALAPVLRRGAAITLETGMAVDAVAPDEALARLGCLNARRVCDQAPAPLFAGFRPAAAHAVAVGSRTSQITLTPPAWPGGASRARRVAPRRAPWMIAPATQDASS